VYSGICLTQLAKKRQSARRKPPTCQVLKNTQRIYLRIYKKQFSRDVENSDFVAHFGVFLPAGSSRLEMTGFL